MANTQAMCTSFLGEVLTATHNFGVAPIRAATTADTFKAALYFTSATVNSRSLTHSVIRAASAGLTCKALTALWPAITHSAATSMAPQLQLGTPTAAGVITVSTQSAPVQAASAAVSMAWVIPSPALPSIGQRPTAWRFSGRQAVLALFAMSG